MASESIKVLIVDDESMIRRTLVRKLEREGYLTGDAEDGKTARTMFSSQSWDLVLLDINLPDDNGLELLKDIHEQERDLPVIMMTGNRSVELVVTAMKRGAYDYITKPFNLDEVMLTVRKALEVTELKREVRSLRASRESIGFEQVIGSSEKMKREMDIARTVASSEADTVLVLGESGTGKNLLAQAIHNASNRAGNPFMEVTCTALPETLLESELFGHERGAFTDAKATKKGLCELAHRGTLFLDEIGDMPMGTQAKLLGFLESRTIRRVGGNRPIPVDLRVIAATNQSIEQMIADKTFREDLYYRLNVIEVTVPPLRERRSDITTLINFFIKRLNGKFKKQVRGVEPDALKALTEYNWPGNVRELRNAVERAMILCKGEVLTSEDLPVRTKRSVPIGQGNVPEGTIVLPDEGISLEDVANDLVKQALEKTRGNQTRAAKLLHISRDQLRYRMKQYNLMEE